MNRQQRQRISARYYQRRLRQKRQQLLAKRWQKLAAIAAFLAEIDGEIESNYDGFLPLELQYRPDEGDDE